MDQKLKPKWVKALRSGEFEQTAGRLAYRHGYGDESFAFCCLGVLCEVAELDFTETAMSRHYRMDGDEVEAFSALTKPMLDTWGITGNNQEKLINMNDGLCKSFDEIANYIEENM